MKIDDKVCKNKIWIEKCDASQTEVGLQQPHNKITSFIVICNFVKKVCLLIIERCDTSKNLSGLPIQNSIFQALWHHSWVPYNHTSEFKYIFQKWGRLAWELVFSKGRLDSRVVTVSIIITSLLFSIVRLLGGFEVKPTQILTCL